MDISKDIYEYLTNFADDRTILNMLSVNKKFNDEEFFKRVLLRKYPLLLEFQQENETLKGLFVRMTYYIAKLEEKFEIPYIPTIGYNPEKFYKTSGYSTKVVKSAAMRWAARGGHIDIVQLMLERGANNFNQAMKYASKGGHIDIVQLMLDKGANDFNEAMEWAAIGGHIDIVQLMLDKGANDDFEWTLIYAAKGGHIDIVQLMLDKGSNDFNLSMRFAAGGGHIDIVRLMLDRGADDFNGAIEIAARAGHKDIVQLMLDKGANNFNQV